MHTLASPYFRHTIAILLIVSLLPLMILGISFIGLFQNSVQKTLIETGYKQVHQLSMAIDQYLVQANQLIHTCANQMLIKNVLSYLPGQVELQNMEDALRLLTADKKKEISVHIVSEVHAFSSTSLPPQYEYSAFSQTELFRSLDSMPRTSVVFSSPYIDAQENKIILSIAMPVCDYHNSFVGYIIVDIYENVFETILSRMGNSMEMALWWNGQLLINSGKDFLPLPDQIKTFKNYTGTEIEGQASGNQCYYFWSRGNHNLLTRSFRMDISEAGKIQSSAISLLLLLIGLSIAGASVLAFVMSIQQSQPILRLLRAMDAVGQGDLTVRVEIPGNTELAQLGKRFNHLITQLDSIYKANVQREGELRKQELAALQAQINPHFIYNSLGAARSLIRLGMPSRASEIITHLSTLLHANLQSIDTFISLQDDIKLIQSYLVIANIRFNDRFRFHCEIPEELMRSLLPVLILQPIVENAVRHGLEPLSYSGDIWLRGEKEAENLILTIEDNGIGISPEMEIRLNSNQAPEGHIGFLNVRRRIELYYGSGYSANIHRLEHGTKVTLRLRFKEGEASCIKS